MAACPEIEGKQITPGDSIPNAGQNLLDIKAISKSKTPL
jgi:hypothetical protein